MQRVAVRSISVDSGAAISPMKPSRNCGPCGASHVIRHAARDESACLAHWTWRGDGAGIVPADAIRAGSTRPRSRRCGLRPSRRTRRRCSTPTPAPRTAARTAARSARVRPRRGDGETAFMNEVVAILRRLTTHASPYGVRKAACRPVPRNCRIIPAFLASCRCLRASPIQECRTRSHLGAAGRVPGLRLWYRQVPGLRSRIGGDRHHKTANPDLAPGGPANADLAPGPSADARRSGDPRARPPARGCRGRHAPPLCSLRRRQTAVSRAAVRPPDRAPGGRAPRSRTRCGARFRRHGALRGIAAEEQANTPGEAPQPLHGFLLQFAPRTWFIAAAKARQLSVWPASCFFPFGVSR